MEDVLDIADNKQLFIDEKFFDFKENISLCVNPPVKAEKVLLSEKPWEIYGIFAYNTICEDKGIYKLWYDAISDIKKPEGRCICYAESKDGINWERINSNQFNWNGIRENNIVMPGATGSVMIDPKGQKKHRYKALVSITENDVWSESKGSICGIYDGKHFNQLYLCTSPDGIVWKRQSPAALPFLHDTQNQLLYDFNKDCYLAYLRTREGGYGTVRTVGRTVIDDPMSLPWPYNKTDIKEFGPDGAAHEVGGEFELCICRDAADPPDTDFYTPSVEIYPWAENVYLSFTTPYRHFPVGDTSNTMLQGKDARGRSTNDGLVDVQLAVSRDGKFWTRPDRKPYVSLGLEGQFDAGQTYMSLGMVKKGDEIWQYYSGTPNSHGAFEYSVKELPCLRRLVQRIDGFISADAAYIGGMFITPLIRFSGRNLYLNANCSALGQVEVEIRDENNHIIDGYSFHDNIPVERNSTRSKVSWKDKCDVLELICKPVRLHFRMRASKLYSFQFEQ